MHKHVCLVLPCWRLAGIISCRPFCTASVICCMLSIVTLYFRHFGKTKRKTENAGQNLRTRRAEKPGKPDKVHDNLYTCLKYGRRRKNYIPDKSEKPEI